MKAVAYMFLSILIVINAIQQNYNIVFMVLSGIIAVVSIYSGVLNVVAFTKIKNQ